MTATVGDFLYTAGSMVETSTGRTLPRLQRRRRPAHAGPAGRRSTPRSPPRPAQINFLSGLYGPYPFESTGAVADRASGVGYALEVQTKPLYSGGFTSGNPSINIGTQLHELAHQWWGNSVTLAVERHLVQRRLGQLVRVVLAVPQNGGDDPAVIFDDLYASTPAAEWAIAPAVLDGDPANLFATSPPTTAGR